MTHEEYLAIARVLRDAECHSRQYDEAVGCYYDIINDFFDFFLGKENFDKEAFKRICFDKKDE